MLKIGVVGGTGYIEISFSNPANVACGWVAQCWRKACHNVGGLPEHIKLKLCEPLRELFKDNLGDSVPVSVHAAWLKVLSCW